MNEKFNKEEIWGLLSKKDQKAGTEDEGEGDGREGDEAGEPKAKHKVDQFSTFIRIILYISGLLSRICKTLINTSFHHLDRFVFCSLVTVRRISLILFLVKLLMLRRKKRKQTPLKQGT